MKYSVVKFLIVSLIFGIFVSLLVGLFELCGSFWVGLLSLNIFKVEVI